MKLRIKNVSMDINLAWQMLLFLVIFQVLIAFVGRSIAPLGPLIGEDLLLTKTQIGLLPTALFLGQSLTALPAGFLTDLIGTRRMLFIIAITLGVSFITLTFLSFFWGVLLMIFIGGFGYGASHSASNRGITDWFQVTKRGAAMGIKQMGITVGSALSVLILLPLANQLGWRAAILSASLILIILSYVIYIYYQSPTKSNTESIVKKIPKSFFRELLILSKNRILLLISLAAMILNGSQVAFNTFIILFAYEFLGISLILSGVLLVIAEIGGSLGRIIWGVLSDKLFKSRRVIILLIISSTTGFMALIFSTLSPDLPYLLIVILTFIFGFCISGFNGIWMNATTEIVPVEKSGLATGFSITIGSWGALIGPPFFGMIVDNTQEYSLSWVFIFFLMMVVTFILLSALRGIKKQGYHL